MKKTIRVLSEDSAPDAFAVVCALTRRILRFVAPSLDSRSVQFLPLNQEKARQAVHGNIWKSTSPRDRQKRIELMRTLVNDVLMERGFVVYHIDADVIWARRKECLNLEQFHHFVAEMVRNYADARDLKRTPEKLKEAFERRLILLVPFYSIESWLYQSTACAIAICDGSYRGKDRERFAAWGLDRGALDEVSQPKDQVALGGRHNLELAEAAIPVTALYDAGKSFAQAVERFRACSDLLET
jgi:hypothetical protein